MRYLLGFVLLIAICACNNDKPRFEPVIAEDLSIEQVDSILNKFKFKYESPILIDSTDHVLIPISTQLLNPRTKYSSDGYEYNSTPRYWNILFYNRLTEQTQLLTNDKVRISSIYANNDEDYRDRDANKIMQGKVFYQIGDIDYNKDGKLNSKDPEFLFVSNINGENLIRISPPNEELQYFKVIAKSKQILLETRRDINRDSIFDNKDESIWYKAELVNQQWKLNEVIDSTGRQAIEKMYFDKWLTK